ncbi:MAG TPA: right-handed parallel beta-helix repeat-containing protein, partial [Chlamydiales bacterium]|nr:right-handed parallel beta-helix repeat-containing protein [Chlamydiales bacterium]
GADPTIKNAMSVGVSPLAQLFANATTSGNGGTIVLWSEIATFFGGQIFATGTGVGGNGGLVEVSSHKILQFNGDVDVSSQSGLPGELFLDPVSITIQSASPDINGNGSGLDITMTTQLNNATTTPTGFGNAASIITAGALSGLLTNNVSVTLAAQTFITVNAPISPAGTNVTLTLEAPTVNLNSPITLASGGVLNGVGVTTVNVGPSGKPQNGIDIVASGGTVNLASATYAAPLNILSKNLTLNGNGQANTTILMTGAVPAHSGRNPAIYVQDGTDVIIQNLTVNGNNDGFPVNPSIVGIFYVNAGGTIANNHITQIANSVPPYGGGQQGNGIRAISNTGGPYTLNIDSNLIDFFQKAGIVVNGTQIIGNFSNNVIQGLGVPSSPAGLGIQFSGGIATISGNTITGIMFGTHNASAGIFVFNTQPNMVISGNTVIGNDEGIFSQDSGAGLTINNNVVQNSGDTGIGVVDTSGVTNILSNTLINNGGLAASGNANSSVYLFSSVNELFNVINNSTMPAAATPALFTQGNAANQAPVVDLMGNAYIDP